MSNTSFTEACCDRCGHTERVAERLGKQLVPVGWARADIAMRNKGRGWENVNMLFNGTICPACIDAIGRFLRQEE